MKRSSTPSAKYADDDHSGWWPHACAEQIIRRRSHAHPHLGRGRQPSSRSPTITFVWCVLGALLWRLKRSFWAKDFWVRSLKRCSSRCYFRFYLCRPIHSFAQPVGSDEHAAWTENKRRVNVGPSSALIRSKHPRARCPRIRTTAAPAEPSCESSLRVRGSGSAS